MTEEDKNINIEISRILGKECLEPIYELMFPGPGKVIGYRYTGKDYCNDLNAMYDAFQWMRQYGDGSDSDTLHWEGIRDQYGYELDKEANKQIKKSGGGYEYIIANLPAKIRAKCFVSCMETINRSNENATVTEV